MVILYAKYNLERWKVIGQDQHIPFLTMINMFERRKTNRSCPVYIELSPGIHRALTRHTFGGNSCWCTQSCHQAYVWWKHRPQPLPRLSLSRQRKRFPILNCLYVPGSVVSFFNLVRSKQSVGAERVQGTTSRKETSSIRARFECSGRWWAHYKCTSSSLSVLDFIKWGQTRMLRGGNFDGDSSKSLQFSGWKTRV